MSTIKLKSQPPAKTTGYFNNAISVPPLWTKTLCSKSGHLREECGKNAAQSEDFEVFAVFPVGHGREETSNLCPFDMQQIVDKLVTESRA